ncbi:glycosyltransferase [Phytohabitans flavus]|uniref:glycosyltransferase n=1 Tax=Phytohabitans flavus TaxID=1076124 RepID=UPI00363F7CD1
MADAGQLPWRVRGRAGGGSPQARPRRRRGGCRAVPGKADYLLAAPRVRRRAGSGGYDLVHVHYGLTSLSSRLVTGVPRVLSLYGSDINEPWQARITRLTAGRPAVRVYPSRRLVEAAGDPSGVVVPNGIDFDLFTPLSAGSARPPARGWASRRTTSWSSSAPPRTTRSSATTSSRRYSPACASAGCRSAS